MIFLHYEKLLQNLLEKNEQYLLLASKGTKNLENLSGRINDKSVNIEVADQIMIEKSAGLALHGKIPIVHAPASFLTERCFEKIKTQIGLPQLPVKLIGSFAGFLSEAKDLTYQTVEDIRLMGLIPGMNIFCPSDEEDLLLGLPEVLSSNSPFYIRYNNIRPAVVHNHAFKIGKAEVISKGIDITILTYGFMLRESYMAKKVLEKLGYSVGLINLRTLKPIDRKEIFKAIGSSYLVVTVEDHFITGSLYSIISSMLVKEKIDANIFPILLKRRWFKPSLIDNVLEYERFTGEHIALKIVDVLQKEKKFITHLSSIS